MDFILTLVIWALCGWGCYKIAENNGRDTTLAAVLGVLSDFLRFLVMQSQERSPKDRNV